MGIMKGSFNVRYEVFDDLRLDVHDVAVYLAILRFAPSQSAMCDPTLTTLTTVSRSSKKTLLCSLDKLEELGYIRRDRGRGKRTTYYVLEPNERNVNERNVSHNTTYYSKSKGEKKTTFDGKLLFRLMSIWKDAWHNATNSHYVESRGRDYTSLKRILAQHLKHMSIEDFIRLYEYKIDKGLRQLDKLSSPARLLFFWNDIV